MIQTELSLQRAIVIAKLRQFCRDANHLVNTIDTYLKLNSSDFDWFKKLIESEKEKLDDKYRVRVEEDDNDSFFMFYRIADNPIMFFVDKIYEVDQEPTLKIKNSLV